MKTEPLSMAVETKLPCCGTTLKWTALNGTAGPISRRLQSTADMLKYVFEDRIKWHRCELVSETNQMGVVPFSERRKNESTAPIHW